MKNQFTEDELSTIEFCLNLAVTNIDSDDILKIVKHLVEKEKTIANLKHEITRFHGAVEQHIKNDTNTSKSVI